jgi:hypothetical protein
MGVCLFFCPLGWGIGTFKTSSVCSRRPYKGWNGQKGRLQWVVHLTFTFFVLLSNWISLVIIVINVPVQVGRVTCGAVLRRACSVSCSACSRPTTAPSPRYSSPSSADRSPLTTYQCSGSMTFWCGSGYADPCLWLIDPDADPDPAIFVIDLQSSLKKKISAYYFLKIHLYHFSKIKSPKEGTKQ